jgi:hypothetical protein
MQLTRNLECAYLDGVQLLYKTSRGRKFVLRWPCQGATTADSGAAGGYVPLRISLQFSAIANSGDSTLQALVSSFQAPDTAIQKGLQSPHQRAQHSALLLIAPPKHSRTQRI